MWTICRIIYGYSNTKIGSQQEAGQLYYAAKKYEIPEALTVARKYMLQQINEQNAIIIYPTAKLFEDHEITQKCCKVLEGSIYNATKAPGFFDNISPLMQKDGNIRFRAAQSMLTINLQEKLKDHRKKLMNLNSLNDLVDNTFATIRLMVNEVKELFDLIISKDKAQFFCYFHLMPEAGSIEKFKKVCNKICRENTCNNLNFNHTFNPLYYNNDSPYQKTNQILRKYGYNADTSAYWYNDVKELLMHCKSEL